MGEAARGVCELQTKQGSVMVPYRLVRSRRFRYIRVRVDDRDEVSINVPSRVADKAALDFLQTQADWVVKLVGRRPPRTTLAEHFRRRPMLSLWGERMRVDIRGGENAERWTVDEENRIVTFRLDRRNDAEGQLVHSVRELARMALIRRTRELAQQHAISLGRVSVRDQRSRWGSCTQGGNVSLNWRLILLPPILQDYVILHELAHIRFMNHSAQYWQHLATMDSRARRHDAELTRAGRHLMRIGRV